VNLKVCGDPMSETYKSLGDVFGINAAVASIAASTGNVRKAVKNSPSQPHLKSSRSVSSVVAQSDPTYQSARLSTYANLPAAPNARFGTPDARSSYNERLSVSRQPTQPPPQRIYSGGHSQYAGTPRRPGMMGPPPPPMTRSIIYKSNTSLDLDHEPGDVVVSVVQPDYQQLRREYGSQGSINVSSGNRFAPAPPPVNPGYRDRIYSGPVVDLGQASPGPAAVSTLQRKSAGQANGGFLSARDLNKSEESTVGSVISNGSKDAAYHAETGSESSPKLAKKKAGATSSVFFSKDRESGKSQKSLFKKLRGSKESNPDPSGSFGKEGEGTLDRQAVLDDCHRRRSLICSIVLSFSGHFWNCYFRFPVNTIAVDTQLLFEQTSTSVFTKKFLSNYALHRSTVSANFLENLQM
jgi:hypothetical protein